MTAGLDISDELQNSIITLVTVLAPILLVADAGIRVGRAANADKIARVKKDDSS